MVYSRTAIHVFIDTVLNQLCYIIV